MGRSSYWNRPYNRSITQVSATAIFFFAETQVQTHWVDPQFTQGHLAA